jgi:hypothetical protein
MLATVGQLVPTNNPKRDEPENAVNLVGVTAMTAIGISPKKSAIQGRFDRPEYLETLLSAGSRAASLGITVLDDQTRILTINASLASETRLMIESHYGCTVREVIGDVARQLEPAFESVLRSDASYDVTMTGRIRSTPDVNEWLNHCFPVRDADGRVRQIGVLVVNVTAEKAALELLHTLASYSRSLSPEFVNFLPDLERSIVEYHGELRASLDAIARGSADSEPKGALLHTAISKLDHRVRTVRELISAGVSTLPILQC